MQRVRDVRRLQTPTARFYISTDNYQYLIIIIFNRKLKYEQ